MKLFTRKKRNSINQLIKKQRFVVLSPLTLGFVLTTIIIFILPEHTRTRYLGASSVFHLGTISHIFVHADFTNHWFNNISMILLLMPACEDHYGIKKLVQMCFVCSVVEAVFNAVLTNYILIGASGIVFMLIVLTPFVANAHETTNVMIPVCFVLVILMFLGKEVYISLTENDQISHLCHVVGGVVGAIFALRDRRHHTQRPKWLSWFFSSSS